MNKRKIQAYKDALCRQEKSPGTIDKYLRDAAEFEAWLAGRSIDRDLVIAWKEVLVRKGLRPVTINSKLCALNCYLRFLGKDELCVKTLRVQKSLFCEESRQLNRAEYEKMLCAARCGGNHRLALLMEAICSTGVRVSEVKYLTVEAAGKGRAEIFLKGKIRVILLPKKLCRKLSAYARARQIGSGPVFLNAGGEPVGRGFIWAEMKRLAKQAGVASEKSFPHNLRHLFARSYYKVCRDLASLAAVLGHSSLETTRIYLVSSEETHQRKLNRLDLIM